MHDVAWGCRPLFSKGVFLDLDQDACFKKLEKITNNKTKQKTLKARRRNKIKVETSEIQKRKINENKNTNYKKKTQIININIIDYTTSDLTDSKRIKWGYHKHLSSHEFD